MQTYKYGEKATKEEITKEKQRAGVGYMPLCCYMLLPFLVNKRCI